MNIDIKVGLISKVGSNIPSSLLNLVIAKDKTFIELSEMLMVDQKIDKVRFFYSFYND